MKPRATCVSVLLAVLNLSGTFATIPVQAQTISPGSKSKVLLSQAVNASSLERAFDQGNISRAVPLVEQSWQQDFETYFEKEFFTRSATTQRIAAALGSAARQTGQKSALIYMVPRSQQLELILIVPGTPPIQKRVSEANREALLRQVRELSTLLVQPHQRNTRRYLPAAQQLYKWLIAPLEADLKAQDIDTLVLCVGSGLRTLPFAALHDGKQFLVEKYSFARIPAFQLVDTGHTDLKNSSVLAMGASNFKTFPPCPVCQWSCRRSLKTGGGGNSSSIKTSPWQISKRSELHSRSKFFTSPPTLTSNQGRLATPSFSFGIER